jgi:hypothetical protein
MPKVDHYWLRAEEALIRLGLIHPYWHIELEKVDGNRILVRPGTCSPRKGWIRKLVHARGGRKTSKSRQPSGSLYPVYITINDQLMVGTNLAVRPGDRLDFVIDPLATVVLAASLRAEFEKPRSPTGPTQ